MDLALRLTKQGGSIAYVVEAEVYHHHTENWQTIERRFEREALALQNILPHVQIRKRDLIRYITTSVWMDWCSAWKEQVFKARAFEIVQYRLHQYWGSFKGNHDSRKLSHVDKEVYFYPTTTPSLSAPHTNNYGSSGEPYVSNSSQITANK